jgi:glycosyltransferase involved in cell wall biosynthesis
MIGQDSPKPKAARAGKPRVAIVIPRYHPVYGGAENQCLLLNRHLMKSGSVEIPFVVTKRISADLERRERIESVLVRRIGRTGIGRLSDYHFFMSMAAFLVRNRRSFDLIHCHGGALLGFIVTLTGLVVRVPVIIKLSSSGELDKRELSSRDLRRWAWSRVSAFVRKYAHLIALTAEGEDELRAVGSSGAYSVIPNGVDTDRFRPPLPQERVHRRARYGISTEEFVLLYTGRMVKGKGIDLLLRSLPDIAGALPVVPRLVLVGSGELQEDSIEAVVRQRAADPRSRITWVQNTDDVTEFLYLADAFVFPSRQEGLPNSVLEALATGLPCILSDIPPHREIAGRSTASNVFLFELENEQSLRHAVGRCVRLLRESGSEHPPGSALNEAYAIACVARQYEALYYSLFGRPVH